MNQATTRESSPARDDLLSRASALVPVLKERAAQTERMRQIPAETVADLFRSELTRIAVPKQFGGLDVGYDVMLEAGAELGRACGATSWCYSIWSAHAWLVGHWPLEGQEEVFGSGPDVLCSSSFNGSQAKTERVDGGIRLSGRWEFSSGCDNAAWVMLGAPGSNAQAFVLVPRSDFEIVDTWFVSGLSGTGSKDITVDDVFVPSHRVLEDPFRGGEGDFTGWRLHGQVQYRVPVRCLLLWDLVTPIVGIAQGVVDEFTQRSYGTSGRARSADHETIQVRLAEASAEVDAARALMRQDIQEILGKGERGESFSSLETARYGRDKAFVAKLCVQAVNRLFEASGAHSLFESDPIQRMHRDALAATHRDGLIFDFGGQHYGRIALGATASRTAN